MLKEFYIDNFKNLTDLTINFDSLTLLIGSNGVGKSNIFEALNRLKTFITGGDIKLSFPKNTFSKSQKQIQNFKLIVELNNNTYIYKLSTMIIKNRVSLLSEQLFFNDKLVIEYSDEIIRQPNESNIIVSNCPSSKSIIFTFYDLVPESIEFFNYIKQKLIILKINPFDISKVVSQEKNISMTASNFASWYKQIFYDMNKITYITELRKIVKGFYNLQFGIDDDGYEILQMVDTMFVHYDFDELSEGQKILLVLYTIIFETQNKEYTLCVDSPENFIELPEIRFLIDELDDYHVIKKGQVLLISNHPYFINFFSNGYGYFLTTKNKIKKFDIFKTNEWISL